ncbi:MAG: transcriptional regulator [Oscillospiraceae bacterium]|nr:transcriptional regulator [Oscillospiraceae bacterium]
MKYYEQLVDFGCFTTNDVEIMVGNSATANSLITFYKKKGLIESVRKGLYVAMSLETKQPVPNRYAIASNVTSDAYVAYHSALEYHGIANQVYYEVFVASKNRFRTFEHDGLTYTFVPSPIDVGIENKVSGVRVTDLERTIIDGINDFYKVGGLDELLRAVEMIPYLDYKKLYNYLTNFKKVFLYQKTGYILEHYKEELKIPDIFFIDCHNMIKKSTRYLYSSLKAEQHVYNKKWSLCVPNNLLTITRKGANYIE